MFDDHSVQAERQFFLAIASRCSSRRVQDSAADGLWGVIFPQGLKPHRAIFPWRLEGDIFSVHPKGIAFLLQSSDELIPCKHLSNGRIDVLLDRSFPRWTFLVLSLPFRILPFSLF